MILQENCIKADNFLFLLHQFNFVVIICSCAYFCTNRRMLVFFFIDMGKRSERKVHFGWNTKPKRNFFNQPNRTTREQSRIVRVTGRTYVYCVIRYERNARCLYFVFKFFFCAFLSFDKCEFEWKVSFESTVWTFKSMKYFVCVKIEWKTCDKITYLWITVDKWNLKTELDYYCLTLKPCVRRILQLNFKKKFLQF